MRIQQRARTSHVPLGVAREALCKMQAYFDGRKATIIRVRDETACTPSSPQKEEVDTIRRIVDWKRTGTHAWVQFLHPIRIMYVMYTRHHARKEEVVENDSDAQLRVDIACAEHSQRHANDLFMRTAL